MPLADSIHEDDRDLPDGLSRVSINKSKNIIARTGVFVTLILFELKPKRSKTKWDGSSTNEQGWRETVHSGVEVKAHLHDFFHFGVGGFRFWLIVVMSTVRVICPDEQRSYFFSLPFFAFLACMEPRQRNAEPRASQMTPDERSALAKLIMAAK